MRIFKTLFFSCLFCFLWVFATSVTVHAADNLSMIGEALEDVSDNMEAGEGEVDVYGENVAIADENVLLGDAVKFTMPKDWVVSDAYAEDEYIRFHFEGTDEEGNKLLFIGTEVDIREMDAVDLGATEMDAQKRDTTLFSYAELMNRFAENGMAHSAVNINGIDLVFISEYDCIAGVLLSRDNRFFAFGFELDKQFISQLGNLPKLKSDMIAILRSMELVRDDTLAQFDKNAPEFKAVTFQNEELGHMVQSVFGKKTVFPTELAVIKTLRIRSGNMTFGTQVKYNREYKQPCGLDLSDLTMFPNLEYLYVCDMQCTNCEALPKLEKLRNLVLIRTELTDLSFLTGMTLRNLDLAGNRIVDFSPIASVNELRTLNLCETGLTSQALEGLQVLDLTGLVAASNPVEDISPLANMSHLERLDIDMTRVSSLEPLRGLAELKELEMRDLEGVISLEPLHDLAKLERIDASNTNVICIGELEGILE